MTVSWGVIGCGGIAYRRTIPGLVNCENSRLIAVMDTDADVAETVRQTFGAEYAFSTAEELLALPEIDAVYIASPVAFHKEQVLMAADAGKHILLEKPMGLSVEESREIAAYCREKGVKLGVGLMMRFHNLHEQIRERITNGELGDIVSMRAQFTCWYPEMEHAWRQKKSLSGGGALMDMGIHCIDLLRYMSGLDVSEVTAMTGNQIFQYEVEDAAALVMRMNNGALCYVDAAFNIPDDATVCKLEIYGTGGSVVLEGTLAQDEAGAGTLVTTDSAKGYDAKQMRKKAEQLPLTSGGGNLYTKEVHAFAAAVLNDGEPPIGASDAISAQAVVEAAYRSAQDRRVVAM